MQKNAHFCPSSYHVMLHDCKKVQKIHPDVIEAFFLESMIYVQMMDGHSAIQTLKTYFDLASLKLNDNMKHCKETHCLAVLVLSPMRYGPILQARVCRLFGDFETARQLLHESLQRALLRGDERCHHLAIIERHVVDIIGNRAILEDRSHEVQIDRRIREDGRVSRNALLHIADLQRHIRHGPYCEDDFEVVSELDSIGKMLIMLKAISEGEFALHYGRNMETGMACLVGMDPRERGHTVSAYGHALMTSNMIRNGMWEQAKSTAMEFLLHNLRTVDEGLYCNESHAVGAANLAYSYAAVGNYTEAEAVIQNMRRNFRNEIMWQSHRHVVICSAVIRFEKCFLLNKYNEAEAALCDLAAHSEIEYTLRRALLLSATGKSDRGLQELMDLKVADVFGRIRILMQIGTIHTSCSRYDMAHTVLNEALDLTDNCGIEEIGALVGRRMATLMMCVNPTHPNCEEELEECGEYIETCGTWIEKVCYYMTWAKIFHETDQDPREYLKQARVLCRGKWPSMEKTILVMVANLHYPSGDELPDADRFSQMLHQFENMTIQHSGRCEWLLI